MSDRTAPDSSGTSGELANGRRRSRVSWGVTAALAAPLVAALVIAICGPLIGSSIGLDADHTSAAPYAAPSSELPLGADYLGRDVVARLLHGGWFLVLVAVISVVIAEVLGAVIGIWMAGRPRWSRLSRYVLDVILVVPPAVSLLVVLTASGANPVGLILLVLTISLPFVARYFQSLATPVMSAGFVEIARIRGDCALRIVVAEVAPNLAVPLAADIGMRFVGAVYLVATASFLGAGALGGAPNWAAMVQQNSEGLSLNPWAVAAPALLIAALTVPASILADMFLERRR